LRQDLGAVRTVAVETEGSVLQGGTPGKHQVEGIGVSFIPKTFDGSLCDSIVRVSDRDAFDMVRRLAMEEGVLGGSSAGANVFASVELARTMLPGQRIVTIIPDSAERYLSKNIFGGGL
jgi:cysteine synthase A